MKKNKFNLDQIFLFQLPLIRDYLVLDNDIEFREWALKYSDERDKYLDFIAKCSIDEYIYIFLFSFRDIYPNVLRLFYNLDSEEISENIIHKTKNVNPIFNKIILERHIGPILIDIMPEIRDYYEKKISIEFNSSIKMNPIEKALNGISYSKNTTEGLTTFIFEDIPIAKIEVFDRTLVLYVNEEKIILYHKTLNLDGLV